MQLALARHCHRGDRHGRRKASCSSAARCGSSSHAPLGRAGVERRGRQLGVTAERVLLPPRVRIDIDDVAVLREAVDERDDACGTRKHAAPLLERQICGDDRRALLVPPVDDRVEELGGLGVARQLAHLVENEYVRNHVAPQPALQRRRRLLLEQVGQDFGERREPHRVPGRERG